MSDVSWILFFFLLGANLECANTQVVSRTNVVEAVVVSRCRCCCCSDVNCAILGSIDCAEFLQWRCHLLPFWVRLSSNT